VLWQIATTAQPTWSEVTYSCSLIHKHHLALCVSFTVFNELRQNFLDIAPSSHSRRLCSGIPIEFATKSFVSKWLYRRIRSLSHRLECRKPLSYNPPCRPLHSTLYSLGKHSESRNWARSLQKRTTFGLVARTGICCLHCHCSLRVCQAPVDGVCASPLLLLAKLIFRPWSASHSSNYLPTEISLFDASE
jgi:hypothetical protein